MCRQTGEFGNYGCAELVVVPGDVPEDAPADYRWRIRAEGRNGRFVFIEHGEDPIPPDPTFRFAEGGERPGPDTIRLGLDPVGRE